MPPSPACPTCGAAMNGAGRCPDCPRLVPAAEAFLPDVPPALTRHRGPEIVVDPWVEPAPHSVASGTVPSSPSLPAPPGPRVTKAVSDFSESHRVAGLPPAQRLVYGLLARTLREYRGEPIVVVLGFLMVPFFAAVGALGGTLVMTATYRVLVAVEPWTGPLTNAALYAIPLLVFGFARGMEWIARDATIELRTERGLLDGLRLGRLHEVFNAAEPSVLGMFFGACFTLQLWMLYYTTGHAGLAIKGSLGECLLLTLDNACHGILIDKLKFGEIYWERRPDPTFWSENIFYAFRVAFDAFALLCLYAAYRRHRIRRLFGGFPHDPRRADELLDWIEARGRVDIDRSRDYLNEFVFLGLARDFIRGDFESVRRMGARFPWLKASAEVRALFALPDGETLLPDDPQAR